MASISSILLAKGEQEAESRRRRAGNWVPLIQTLASLPGQVMADRAAEGAARESAYDRAQQRAVRGQQLAKGEQELATAEATVEQKRQMNDLLATPGVIGEDGRFDTPGAQRIATEKGYRDILDDVLLFGKDWNEGVEKGLLTKEQIESAKRANQPQPTKLEAFDPTRDLRDPVTGELKVKGTPEVKPETRSLQLQANEALKGGNTQEYARIMRVIKDEARASRDPNTNAVSFQSKDVLNDAGKPVAANFNPRTGQYIEVATGQPITNPRPVPSAMETQDARKFKQAEPILRSVSELSERINTGQGLIAKISGSVEKAKAQANYNDDVAEYEALISGFTPLVARALGHTGVLTQQDVDSVKALFPKPGDSKSLRDRKIARIKSIIGELETGAGGTPTATDQPPPAGIKIISGEEVP